MNFHGKSCERFISGMSRKEKGLVVGRWWSETWCSALQQSSLYHSPTDSGGKIVVNMLKCCYGNRGLGAGSVTQKERKGERKWRGREDRWKLECALFLLAKTNCEMYRK